MSDSDSIVPSAFSRTLVHTQFDMDSTVLPILTINTFKDLFDHSLRLLVRLHIRSSETQHQRVRRFLLFWAFEKLGSPTTEAQTSVSGRGNKLHVRTLLSEHTPSDMEFPVLFDTNEKLALPLVAPRGCSS